MKTLRLANRSITTKRPAFIMGIVNCTPDSFYSKSRGGADLALELVEQGADIIDLGGESTRPGSEYVSAEEEIKRLLPVIREIRKHSDIPLSIDTRKLDVMSACFDEGADIVNDVSAFEDSPLMADFAAENRLPVILMHKKGIPSSMQDDTLHGDAFFHVDRYLRERVDFALSRGIDGDKIILDPGIGFGKDLEANIQLIKNCGRLYDGKYKVMMALSRKTCIGQMTGADKDDRLIGTVAADLFSVERGAEFLRVHDVASCRQSLDVLKSLL